MKETLEEYAEDMVGNWQKFDSFAWFEENEIDKPHEWCIVYTRHRDAGLMEESNAEAIEDEMEPFLAEEKDIRYEDHNHWAVGWVSGYAIRVYDAKDCTVITPAFKRWHELQCALSDYPILDESDYSDREYEATIENILEVGRCIDDDYDLPDGWEYEVYSWLSQSEEWSNELENVDDQGGYPSEESVQDAFEALGWKSEIQNQRN